MLTIKPILAKDLISIDSINFKQLNERKEFAIEFPSKRAFSPYKKLYEAIEIINSGNFSYQLTEKVAHELGPYALSEFLQKKLQMRGIYLKEGIVPYMAPCDFLEETQLILSKTEKFWDMHEIEKFFKEHNLTLLAIDLPGQAKKSLENLYRVRDQTLSCWQLLEALDCLECHRQKYFRLWARFC